MTALLLIGRVRTFDPGRPWADAVAVRDGRITAVGTVEECRTALPARTQHIDAAMVLPAFTDSHVHPLYGGLDLTGCNLHEAADRAGYLDMLGRFARARPDAAWIVGGGWALAAFPSGLPTAADLDIVTGPRPAYLVNTDRHGAWVNTAALRTAGIDASTPNPPDGRIERHPDGSPTGMLHEGAAALVAAAMPAPSPAELRRALMTAQQHLHAQGISAWQDAIVGDYLGYPDPLPVYADLAGRGELTATVELALWWHRDRGVEQLPDLLHRRSAVAGVAAAAAADGHQPALRAGTVKIMVDGIVENGSAAVHEPYRIAPGGSPGNHRGRLFVGGDELTGAVTAADRAGFAVHLHAIGDRAVTAALDAVAAARHQRSGPGRYSRSEENRPNRSGTNAGDGVQVDAGSGVGGVLGGGTWPRHHIAHLQLVARADIGRFAELGVTANLQLYWAADDQQVRTLCRPLLGDDRVDRQYPFADLLRAGAPLAAGSDWPVSSASVLAQVQVAVTRRPADEPDIAPLAPDQALDVDTALAACTIGGAALHGRPAVLRPGAPADLVLLGADPYRVPATEIGTVPVRATIAAGRVVFAR
jgi:predicted amidohydrolase YtcJ